ncbi:MAG TPA: O-methyltransferase [Caulobacteraceae bacterium]|jgi:predicted O-methyltransferase YrrM|nr:O-methyltransferase [Caulobacteraceae bacterium]
MAGGAERWAAVDHYVERMLLDEAFGEDDGALGAALQANAAARLPAIDVAPAQGKFLQLLARIAGAQRILEVGSLGGYSTIWLARAVGPQGRVVSLEIDPHHAEVARANLARAGLAQVAEVRVGPALETLPKLHAEGAAPFDFVFIDADKPNNPGYLAWAVKLARPGATIVVDNVIRGGAVLDGTDANASGARALFEAAAKEPRLSASALQTVGVKGWDGLMLLRLD